MTHRLGDGRNAADPARQRYEQDTQYFRTLLVRNLGVKADQGTIASLRRGGFSPSNNTDRDVAIIKRILGIEEEPEAMRAPAPAPARPNDNPEPELQTSSFLERLQASAPEPDSSTQQASEASRRRAQEAKLKQREKQKALKTEERGSQGPLPIIAPSPSYTRPIVLGVGLTGAALGGIGTMISSALEFSGTLPWEQQGLLPVSIFICLASNALVTYAYFRMK